MKEFFDKIENKGKQDINFISFIRLFATFIVLLNHVFINCGKDFPGVPAPSWDAVTFNHYITYAMFMMTGYTFMKIKGHMTFRMSFLMIFKYYIAMMLCAIPFSTMELVYNAGYHIDWNIVKSGFLNALNGVTWDHLWYIYVLLLVYLLLPFLSRIYKSDNNLILPGFTLLTFLAAFFNLIDFKIVSRIYMFNWVPLKYVFFAVTFGAFVYRYNLFSKIKWWMYAILIVVLSCLYFKTKNFNIVYVISCLLFLMCKEMFKKKNKIVNYLSTYTFIIYLIHVFFLHILTKILMINPFAYGGYIGCIIFTILLYVVTLLVSMIIKKIPFLRELYF